ncbi:SSI family serine proteinase inhibitor [Kitasatospora sp. NPDC088548]|uniref:SSI family serine proteinase inhibitor n=1 Tax=Kitasatospora sp. NPDC088548 TaxID=3364075 RepID=UPI003817B397
MTTTAIRRLVASAAVAVVITTTLGAAPATRPASADSLGLLQLSVTRDEDGSLVENFVLTCDPNGGTHPDPDAACAALTAADGDFDRLVGDPDRFCPDYYDPVTADAEGEWNGQRVAWQKTFTNQCFLERATTPVF